MSIDTELTPTVLSVGKALVRNFDTFSLLIFSFVSMFVMLSFDMCSPLIMVEVHKWGMLEINAVMFGSGMASCAIMVVLVKKPPSVHYNVAIGMAGFATMAFMELLYIIVIKFHYNLPVVVAAWSLYALSFGIIALVEEIFLVSAMALFVPSNVQSFAESLRQTMSRIGTVTALMTSGWLFHHQVLVCYVLVAVMIVMIAITIARRRQLRNPTQIKF